jgi:hypothetical protein
MMGQLLARDDFRKYGSRAASKHGNSQQQENEGAGGVGQAYSVQCFKFRCQ